MSEESHTCGCQPLCVNPRRERKYILLGIRGTAQQERALSLV